LKFLKILKENIVYIVILLVAIIVFNVKLPYYVMAPGGVIELNDRVVTEDNATLNGSINMLYVSEYDGTIASLFMASIIKGWDISKLEEKQVSHESVSDIHKRNEIMRNNSLQNAIYVAYTKAGKEISIKAHKNIILATTLNNNLQIGDIIMEVDDKPLDSITTLKSIINEKENGDTITLKILRDSKEMKVTTKIFEEDNQKVIGIVAVTNYEYELEHKIDIKFKSSETGSSGGLMLALSIYDAISDEDLLKGRTIAGTGTIDIDGTVGEIDGIKYKLMGAVKNNINLVFVPRANYEEAMKVKDEYNYDVEIVKVNTFGDAIEYLKNN